MRRGRADDIALGEGLRYPLYDRMGNMLIDQGAVIACEGQLARLLERGFLIDDGSAPAAHVDDGPVDVTATTRRDRGGVFDDVLELAQRLQRLHDQLLARSTARFGPALRQMVDQLEDLADRDADAALASMQLQATEDGLAPRLVHAAVLCHRLASALGMEADARRSTLAAALTYDVALTPIAGVLNRQKEPPTPSQRAAIDRHPADACALLQAAGIDDPLWLAAVLQHHERVDGSGYPEKLAGDAIALPGRILGIVDSFSAMVRPRAYREAVLSRQALRDIFLARSRSVDERLAHVFVKEIGMYPPGSLVRLASGETAVVVRRGAQVTHPEVRVVLYAEGTRALAHPLRDTRDPAFEISEGVAALKHRAILASVHELWRS